MKIFPALASLLILGMAASCSKNSNTPEPTKTDNISASAWTYDNAGIDNDRNGTIDYTIPASLAPPACRTDNLLSFKKDNTGVTDEGTTKCTSTDPQTSAFNWTFADNEANLSISNNVFSLLNGKSKILALTATSFSLSRDTVIALLSSQPVALIVNLKH